MSLWESIDAERWSGVLAHADAAREAVEKKRPGFNALDRDFEGLGNRILQRSPPHLTQEELVLVVDWKLKRGKWRPKLLDYAKVHSNEDVIKVSTEAFKRLDSFSVDDESVCKANTTLCKLKGVGPATASALLSLVSQYCPFMSDEALNLTATPRDYSLKSYTMLQAKLRLKAQALGKEWTPTMVERALWSSCYMSEVKEDQKEMPAKKKAKR
jgi:hypothetical protein